MKKIFLIAYSKENLGDDLFIDILVGRYPKTQFYTRAIKEDTYLYKKYNNLNYMNYNIDDLISQPIDEFDAIVYIGGSIFMEHAGGVERIKKLNELAQKCKQKDIPFCFISSNFGPYTTSKYKQETEKLLENITDICFRDKASYEEFKHIKTVRYAPDVVLSYDKKFDIKKDTVGISVINFKFRKDLKHIEKMYYETIKNSIQNYVKQGKNVTLFSFCEYEGDEETIDNLINDLPKEKIKIEKYRGDTDKFIEAYASMEYCICSRFHAMILSLVYKQKVIVLSYSDKINNVIKDFGMNTEYINLREIEKVNTIDMQRFKSTNLGENIINQSTEQFKKLNEIIEKNKKINDFDK